MVVLLVMDKTYGDPIRVDELQNFEGSLAQLQAIVCKLIMQHGLNAHVDISAVLDDGVQFGPYIQRKIAICEVYPVVIDPEQEEREEALAADRRAKEAAADANVAFYRSSHDEDFGEPVQRTNEDLIDYVTRIRG